MNDASVFLVVELWMVPGTFRRFKEYRIRVNDVLASFDPEPIFHNHYFEGVRGERAEGLPTAIEIVRFADESTARAALAALDDEALRAFEREVFHTVRLSLSRYAPPDGLKD